MITQTPFADLEISLRHSSGDDYALEARFQLTASAAHDHLISGAPPQVRLDFDLLTERQLTPDAYGATLSQAFFADSRVVEALVKARAQAESRNIPLRLRLHLATDDGAIHALRWETLQVPNITDPLACSERILFSRHLDSTDMIPLQIGPRDALRVLLAVAGPPSTALARYNLAPVDVSAELTRIQSALGDLPTAIVASGQGVGVTLDALVAALRDGSSIMVLVAHGTLRSKRSYLWLDDGHGGVEGVEGDKLVKAISRLPRRPLLALLLSCQSASDGAGEALAGIGPQLAIAGVPAVVAMQGNLSMASAAQMLPTFFTELKRDGQVDRALAVARQVLRGSGDWWQPALFMRIADGRIWQDEVHTPTIPTILPPPSPDHIPNVSGFVGRATELAKYSTILAQTGIVILTGMPGIGKSWLASALARQVADPATTFWHKFCKQEGVDSLIWALAGFLAHRGRPMLWELYQRSEISGSKPPTNILLGLLVQLLEGSELLLCLDDLHWVDEDPQLVPLLDHLHPLLRNHQLRVVITSRRIPPVMNDTVEALDKLSIADAQLLLTERGIALNPDLEAQLYAHIGGNAQLLVFAADALRRISDPAQLINALIEVPDIERYLLEVIDKGLKQDEKNAMHSIAVLLEPGGTRPAIEALIDGGSVRRLLRTLSDRYLLMTQETAVGRVYYQHAIVQHFYYEELGSCKRVELHRRAAAYYETKEPNPLRAIHHYLRADVPIRAAELAVDHVSTAINNGQATLLSNLVDQIATTNLDPALAAALDTVQAELLALRGEYMLAYDRLEHAIAAGATLGDPASTQAHRQILLAKVFERTGQSQAAELACRDGLALLTNQTLPSLEVTRLYIQLAEVLMRRRDFDAADAACVAGLAALPRAPASPHERGELIKRQATIAGERGFYAAAITDLEQCLALSRQTADPILETTVRYNLGHYYQLSDQMVQALECYNESLRLAKQVGDLASQWDIINGLGTIHQERGEISDALRCYEQCRDLSEQYNLQENQADAINNIGMVFYEQGQLDMAFDQFKQAQLILEQVGIWDKVSQSLSQLGDIALRQGNALAAAEYGQQALDLAKSHVFKSCALRVLGKAHLVLGEVATAANDLSKAWQYQQESSDPYDEALIRAARAHLARVQGDYVNARAEALLVISFAHKNALGYLVEEMTDLLEQLDKLFPTASNA